MQKMTSNRFRWAWWLLAYASLGLGLVGVVVPGLPTVPFVLLSAYAAARGSERLHRWLLAHRVFGPMIVDWQVHGDRKSVVWGKSVSVRVDLGGCPVIKKKKNKKTQRNTKG